MDCFLISNDILKGMKWRLYNISRIFALIAVFLWPLLLVSQESNGDFAWSENNLKVFTIQFPDSCIAAFSYDLIAGENGTVQFTDLSEGPVDLWNWDFGDGNTSEEQSPLHTFSQEGLYTVCLEVTDSTGTYADMYCEEILIEMTSSCNADFDYEVLQDEILTVAFTDLSEGPLNSWSWDFGDGSSSASQNPTHVFADTGTYMVSLTVYNSDSLNYCNDSIPRQVQVFVGMPDCIADFNMHPDSGVNRPLLYHFHDNSQNQPDAWLWNFGDGDTSSDQNPVHQYEEPGDYEVSLTVTKINPWGEDCVDTKTETMQTPDYFHIGGFVYAGNFPINNPEPTGDTALVYLYRYHDQENIVNLDTSLVIEYGYFHALFLLEDHYMIKFRLTDGSANAPYYFPTYFGDKKRWQHSPTLFLTDSSHYEVNVNLVEIPELEGGVGAISGEVVHHSNTDAQVPAYDSEILMFNSNDQAVAYSFSDETGEFTFENLAFDTYTLYAESTGLFTEPVTVTISETNPTIFDVKLDLYDSDVTSTGEIQNPDFSDIKVFPNPVINDLTLIFKPGTGSQMYYEIFDFAGRVVKTGDLFNSVSEGQHVIDFSPFNKGIYFIQVISGDGLTRSTKKFIK